jgi:WD40 repeat protein
MRRSHCLTPAELTAFNLGELPETVVDEVAEHLEQCPRCEGAARALDCLSDPVIDGIRDSAAEDTALVERSPARVGDYEILGELGRGGMGVVYRARHLQLGRVAALKMLLGAEFSDPQERARFQTEAAAVARLQHPNIVQVYEAGQHATGDGVARPYFTLEYVAGGSLAQRLGGGPQPPRQAAAWLEPLARAVHYAHEHGVVHRDLKPSNVLLTADNQPKLCDFGVAKVLAGSDLKTRSGMLIGTAEYMAPEQAAGRADIGPAADVYALGALLYTLLVGRPPFQGASPLDTLAQVAHQEPVSPRRLQPAVPRDLETICLKCLQKDPRKRYASALALADDLGRFQGGKPIQARPVGPLERLGKWGRRQPAAAVALASVVLLTVMAFVLVAQQVREANERAERKAQEARQAEETRREQARQAAEIQRVQILQAKRKAEDFRKAEEAQREQVRKAKIAQRRAAFEAQLAQQALAKVLLTRATTQCEQGETALGLLTFAHGLEAAVRAGDADLERVARQNLALWRQQLIRQRGAFAHPDWVTVVALSPDRRTVATACLDGAARLWDAATGKPIGEPLRHRHPVWAVAFSPDGKTLLTGTRALKGLEGEVRLWDVAGGKARGEPLDERGHVRAVAFSAAGDKFLTVAWHGNALLRETWLEAQLWDTAKRQRLGPALRHDVKVAPARLKVPPVLTGALSREGKYILTSGEFDGAARLWDAVTGKMLAVLQHADRVEVTAFSPDGGTVLTGSWDGTARLWETATGRPTGFVMRHRGPVRVAAFGGPNGSQVATGSAVGERDEETRQIRFIGGEARVWDAATGKPLGLPLAHPQPVRAVALTPDGLLLTGTEDRCARVFDTLTGQLLGRPLLHEGTVMSCALSADGRTAVTGAAGAGPAQTARLWDLPPAPQAASAVLASKQETWCMAFNRDGKTLATGGRDGTVRLWGLRQGKLLAEPLRADGWVTDVALSHDGLRLAAGWTNQTVRVWDRAGGRLLHTWRFAKNVPVVAFSPDDQTILTACDDGTVSFREAAGGKVLGKPLVHDCRFRAAAFARDGETVVTVTEDGWLRRWDWKACRVLSAVQLPARPSIAALTPDTRSVLTARGGPHAQLWAVADGKPQGPPLSHKALAVGKLCFSDDGKTILASADDRAARLWDAATGQPLGPPLAHASDVLSLAFVPGGRVAVTAVKAGPLHFWKLPAPVTGSAESVRLRVELLTALAYDAHGMPHELDEAALVERRQRLEKLGGLPEPEEPEAVDRASPSRDNSANGK